MFTVYAIYLNLNQIPIRE